MAKLTPDQKTQIAEMGRELGLSPNFEARISEMVLKTSEYFDKPFGGVYWTQGIDLSKDPIYCLGELHRLTRENMT